MVRDSNPVWSMCVLGRSGIRDFLGYRLLLNSGFPGIPGEEVPPEFGIFLFRKKNVWCYLQMLRLLHPSMTPVWDTL